MRRFDANRGLRSSIARAYLLSLVTGMFLLSPSTLFAAESPPVVTNIAVDLKAGRIFIAGATFGPTPKVEMGCEDGTQEPLKIIFSNDSLIEASLITYELDPGTYLVVVSNSRRRRAKMDVTIGAHITTDTYSTSVGAYALEYNTAEYRQNTAVGTSALRENTTGIYNTATGANALRENTTASGNTAMGTSALRANTTGHSNTANGKFALRLNIDGQKNTATGYAALQSNTEGSENTAFGRIALAHSTKGMYNTAIGSGALRRNVTGSFNTASGRSALRENTSGSRNTAVGQGALLFATGDDNTAIGNGAGLYAKTGSNNIYINNDGMEESNTIRIGNSSHLSAFIAGVPFKVPSSKRFKKDIHEMAEASASLMRLRPVTFRYKEEYDVADGRLQYGVIAEEVAAVFPDLVVYNEDGTPQTVRYHLLATLLLNELQKQYHVNQEQAEAVAKVEQLDRTLQGQVAALAAQAQELAILKVQTAAVLELNARVAALEAPDAMPLPVADTGWSPAGAPLQAH